MPWGLLPPFPKCWGKCQMLQKLFPRTIPPHPNLGTLARAWCSPSIAPSATISLVSQHPEALSSPLPCPGVWGAGVPEHPRNPARSTPDPQSPPPCPPSLPAHCGVAGANERRGGRRQRAALPGSGMGSGDPRGQRDPPLWAEHPPGSGKPTPGHSTRVVTGEGAGGRSAAAHHRLLDLVVDGHHAGSGGAGRERRGRGSAPNTSLPQGSVDRDTSPPPVHRGVPPQGN